MRIVAMENAAGIIAEKDARIAELSERVTTRDDLDALVPSKWKAAWVPGLENKKRHPVRDVVFVWPDLNLNGSTEADRRTLTRERRTRGHSPR